MGRETDIKVRLEPDTKEQLRVRARSEDLEMADIIRRAIRRYLEATNTYPEPRQTALEVREMPTSNEKNTHEDSLRFVLQCAPMCS